MALLPGNTPKRTRLRLLDVMPKGTMGGGNEKTTVGSGTDVPVKLYVPTGQSADSLEVLNPSEVVLFAIDQNGNIKQGGVTSVVSFAVQKQLTSANLLAMNATPISVMPAPGAGIAIVVDSVLFEMKRTTTAYASGGTVLFQYHTATTPVAPATIPAARLTTAGAANTLDFLAGGGGATNSLACAVNDGIDITNNTGAFTTGTGIAVVTLFGWYVTL